MSDRPAEHRDVAEPLTEAAARTLTDDAAAPLTDDEAQRAATPTLHWSTSEIELSNHHRVMSAALGAFLTSLVVTPFDVVKTRLQSQINSMPRTTAGSAASAAARSSAAASSVVSALPAVRPTASQLLLEECSHYRLHTGLMDSWCNNCFSKAGPETSITSVHASKAADLRFTGAFDAAVKLVRHEGLSSLWRGLSPTILMSIPSTVVYFSLYDKAKLAIAGVTSRDVESAAPGFGHLTPHLQTLSPLLAGVVARAITTTLVSPIELVRTKSQSMRVSASMRSLLVAEWRKGGLLSLWRGVGPTLMRDVPFSALYWSSYEYSKLFLLDRWGADIDARQQHHAPGEPCTHIQQRKAAWLYASFLSGAGSGMLAAAITHPFDLIKTRRQIELYRRDDAGGYSARCVGHSHVHAAPAPSSASPALPSTTWAVARTIVAEEGYRGLLSGLSARITKIAPACAIMISTYEASKMMFGERAMTAHEAEELAELKRRAQIRHQHE